MNLNIFNPDTFLELTHDLLCILNARGDVKYVNDNWEQVLGLKNAFLLNSNIQPLIHPDDVTNFTSNLSEILNSKTNHDLCFRLTNSSGKYRWFKWKTEFKPNTQLVYCVGSDITEQKHSQAVLDALEKSTGVGVWSIDPIADEVNWSKKTYEIHEADPAEFTPTLETAVRFYPDEAMAALKDAMDRMASGEEVTFELPMITAKNNRIWVKSKMLAEIRDNVVVKQYGTFEDITKKREAEIATQKLKERVELAMRASNIGVWEYDINTDYLTWDDQLFITYDSDKSTFKNSFRDWEKLVLKEDLARVKPDFAHAIKHGGLFDNQFRIRTRAGDIRHIAAIGKVTKDENDVATIITGINWDITEQVLATKALRKAKEKAEAADIAKSNFLANMSHEIRTPLNGILGALQLLDKAELNQEKKLVDLALNSTNGLIRIINDILDFSKIQANALELEMIPVNIEALVQQVLDEQRLYSKKHNVTCQTHTSNQFKGFWKADPVRLKQILNNLINNAFKFTNQGEINIRLFLQNKMLVIEIEDSGIGMHKEELIQLFTPFKQADESTMRKYGGTGLGLAISKQLVELFKGKISVTSELKKGSKFVLELPFDKVDSAQCSEQTMIEEPLPILKGKVIFVAEDNEVNKLILSEMLKPTEAKFLMFNDGEALLKGLEKKTPDLILCDIMMPKLDGNEACKQIRENNTSTPVIAFTASVTNSDTQEYYQNGFTDILAKPVLIKDLNQILRKYLTS